MGIDHSYSAAFFNEEKQEIEFIVSDSGRRSFNYDECSDKFWAFIRENPKGLEIAMRYESDFQGETNHRLKNGSRAIEYGYNECTFPAMTVGENLFIVGENIYTARNAPLFFDFYEHELDNRSVAISMIFDDEFEDDYGFFDVYSDYLKRILPQRVKTEYLDKMLNLCLSFSIDNMKLIVSIINSSPDILI